jgi:hypothetical protein
MALESGTFINSLVVTNPTSADAKSQGDDHLRLIKSTLKNTFAEITGAVTASHTELNFVKGVTSAIQTQLNNLMEIKGAIAGQVWTGVHNFTSATINVATQSTGDSSTRAASTEFVASTAFSSALPAQTGNAGKFITTNGTTASWDSMKLKLYFLQG